MTKLFRLRVKDGYVCPATKLTNCHGTDMKNMLVPGPVGVAIIAKKVDWRDVVRCVASGKDPSVLLKTPDAAKPRQELADAPDFAQETAVEPEKDVAVVSELVTARAENRPPDLLKLTSEELAAQAALVGIDPAAYKTQGGLVRAVQKKMDEAAS